ncbi:dioxygenase [Streptomyces sp. NPDC088921]|uniref:dioxygenase n=1 Tax=unclassified Streptomyces TaxID=2593676 RepID=UPI00341FECD4
MIIQDETQLTAAVLAETERAGDPRVKEITQALVRHLHGFAREVRLTEKEFDTPVNIATKAVSRTGADCTEVKCSVRRAFGVRGQATPACRFDGGEQRGRAAAVHLGVRSRCGQPGLRSSSPSSFCGTAWTRSP